MEYEEISNSYLDRRNRIIIIELKPLNDEERSWIKQAENFEENEKITNYLLFCLGERYSVNTADPLGNNRFKLTVFDNFVK